VTDSEYTRVDMHTKILTDEVTARAKRRGIDVLVYAPHFTRLPDIQRKAARYTDDELLVVPAREILPATGRTAATCWRSAFRSRLRISSPSRRQWPTATDKTPPWQFPTPAL